MSENQPEQSRDNLPPTLAPEDHLASIPTLATPSPAEVPAICPETLPVRSVSGGITPLVKGYEFLGKLGEGGMGIVFRARQVALNRTVALKMIRSGEFAKGEDLMRFRQEAEAVAQLEHPSIIRIYDVGEHEGQPYFTMELADAGNLADRLTGKPLLPQEAARVLETLARAMHHAHQRGIVHRDLKPVNVLLSTSGSGFPRGGDPSPGKETGSSILPLAVLQPKISDFGLAKRLDSKGRTETGRLLGTVNYMAPEQAEGRSRDVGPRTDVYGLGAILYECLTGFPPFHADTIIATLEKVRHDEPQSIREVNPACPRDLETICLKCLEKSADRRYGSTEELANDLAHFQAGEPILARPVSNWERVWRVVQRRRREVLWGGCAALALLILSVFLVRQLLIKKREKEQLREDYLQSVQAIDETREAVAERNRSAEEIERLLKELPRHYQQVQQHVEEASLKEQAAVACDGLGEVLWNGGRKFEASEACQTATRLYTGLLEVDPQRGKYRDELSQVRLRHGQIFSDFRDYDAAEREYRLALTDLDRLCEQESGNRDYQRHLAEVHHQLGVLYDTRKKRNQAVEEYLEGLKIRESLARNDPGNRSYRRDLARSHGYLGDTYLELGEKEKAWQAYEDSEKIRQKLVDEKSKDPQEHAEARFQLARSHGNEGYYAQFTGDVPRSLKAFEKARVIQQKLVDDFPRIANYKSDLGWSLLAMAEMKLDLGEPRQSVLALLKQAEELFSSLLSASVDDRSYARNLARTHVNLALAYLSSDKNRTRESLSTARRIMERLSARDREQQLKEDPDDLYQLALVESLDGSLLGSDEKQKRWDHADRAMVNLDLAFRHGFARANRLERGVIGLKLPWEVDEKRMSAILQRCQAASKR